MHIPAPACLPLLSPYLWMLCLMLFYMLTDLPGPRRRCPAICHCDRSHIWLPAMYVLKKVTVGSIRAC